MRLANCNESLGGLCDATQGSAVCQWPRNLTREDGERGLTVALAGSEPDCQLGLEWRNRRRSHWQLWTLLAAQT
jgi:hypothetical protein